MLLPQPLWYLFLSQSFYPYCLIFMTVCSVLCSDQWVFPTLIICFACLTLILTIFPSHPWITGSWFTLTTVLFRALLIGLQARDVVFLIGSNSCFNAHRGGSCSLPLKYRFSKTPQEYLVTPDSTYSFLPNDKDCYFCSSLSI